MKAYKLTFESVSPLGPGAQFYRGDVPCARPEEVPDEFWHVTEVEHDGSRADQYTTLRMWAESGQQLIRNVRWFEAETTEPEWVERPGPGT